MVVVLDVLLHIKKLGFDQKKIYKLLKITKF